MSTDIKFKFLKDYSCQGSKKSEVTHVSSEFNSQIVKPSYQSRISISSFIEQCVVRNNFLVFKSIVSKTDMSAFIQSVNFEKGNIATDAF